jgi:putative oxidoreductase
MGLRPSKYWAMMAGGSEFAGGVLTALGLGGGLGPVTIFGPMGMAIGTAHWACSSCTPT